ncbi:helix-turn-helix domain-containing protein [Nodularia spumigena]|uniref:helix-turn-helix domain-containing protein n=2 Tax=Nodularia spumigena TaxID=70799 RepID=UPI000D30BD92
MLLSIKTKLKLTKAQEIIMSKHAGIARFTYNWGLATWRQLYKDGFKPNKYILKKFFNNHVKTEFDWIKEKGICQKITQYAFDNLGDAFSRFFSAKSDYPNFKKKGRNAIATLQENPRRCNLAVEHEIFPEEVRQLLYGKSKNIYRLLFTIRDTTVYILYVRHSAQAPLTLDELEKL